MLEFQDPTKLVPLWTFLALVIAGGAALATIRLSSILPQVAEEHERFVKMAGVFLLVSALLTGICAFVLPQTLAIGIGLVSGLLVVLLPVLRKLALTLINAVLSPFRLLWRAMVRVYLAVVRAWVTRAFPELLSGTLSRLDTIETKIEGLYRDKPSHRMMAVLARWPDVVERVKAKNEHVGALLKPGEPIAIEHNELTLRFPYPFHKGRIEEPKTRTLIEETASEVLGFPIKLRCVLHSSHSGNE